ncbi:MAG: TonB-dependent receptor [Bacteroidales bacterium]|nr:TonB-dependent receptor [Bacteroidales bacterium]
MKGKYLLTLGLLLALCLSASAQKGRITGKVIDKQSSKGVEYASVTLLKPSDSSLVSGVGAVTSGNGSFELSAPYGTYLLRVSFMGYATYIHPQQVTLSAQRPTASLGKLTIAPSAAMLDAVVVSAQRTMVEYQLDKRVVNVDKNIVASGGTATDVLQNVPSVSIDNDGNVSLRGSSNVKVLINGRPYELMGNDLESLLEQTPASSVESVEVITNPSAKYDPEGMSGIINIKLKDVASAALGLNGMVSVNAGMPLSFLGRDYPESMQTVIPTAMTTINLNYTTEKYNLFFSADGGYRSRGHIGHTNIERLTGGTPWNHDTLDQYSVGGNSMGSVKLGGEYYFNEHNSLLVSYQLRGGNRHHANDIYATDLLTGGLLNYHQTDTSDNRNSNHSINMHYAHKFSKKDQELTADATFSMRHMTGEGSQEQFYNANLVNNVLDSTAIWDNYYLRTSNTENRHKSLNLQLNYAHPFDFGWKLETGYEGRMDWPDQNAVYHRTDYDALHQLNQRYDSLSSTHFNYRQQVHAIYATFGGKLSEQLSLQGGLRGEYATTWGEDLNHPGTKPVDKTYWQLYPTLHLSYEISKMQSLQLSYSRRVRRPHMWDLNPYINVREGQQMNFGNPNLDPEFTNAFELSYNLGFDKVNLYSSAYFRQSYNMMTWYGFVWDSASAAHYSWWEPYNSEYDGYWASTPQNLSNGLNYGIEFIVDWQVTKWWKLNVSLNLYKNRIEGTELLDNKTTEAFQASGKFNSFMTLPGDWTIQFSGQYFAPWLDLQTKMYASYWCDLAVKKDILQKRATVNLRVGDLFCTGGWGHETFNEQMNRVMRSKRLSPTVTIGFSYKIGRGLKQQRPDGQDMDDASEGDDVTH